MLVYFFVLGVYLYIFCFLTNLRKENWGDEQADDGVTWLGMAATSKRTGQMDRTCFQDAEVAPDQFRKV